MSPLKITELAKLLRRNGDKILSSEFTLTLSGLLLSELNEAFKLITDTIEIGPPNNIGNLQNNFQVLPPNNATSPVFGDLQLIYDFIQKTTLLRIVQYAGEEKFVGAIDISKFRSLRRLELQKINIAQIKGLQAFRPQLEQLICIKSLSQVDEVITECGGDHSNGFVWNELKLANFSYNGLQTIDSALEFAQYLQHLNLSHNQLVSATAIKWLPHLKSLDLSFNRLTFIPQLHMEANKRLQTLNMSNNYVEDLLNLTKLEALTDLDLSDNCLLDHTSLLPISVLITLRSLNLIGNPLECHPKHRLATSQFLHKNTATVKFVLDFEPLSKQEKAITGTQQLRLVGSLNRMTYAKNRSSSAASINVARLTPISMHTPASSVGSVQKFKFENQTDGESNQMNASICSIKKRNMKSRTVEIDEQVDDESTAVTVTVKQQQQQQQQQKQKQQIDDLELKVATNAEHLAEKRQTEELRQKYGADWLKFREEEIASSGITKDLQENEQTLSSSLSRQLFNDYLGEYSKISTPKHVLEARNDVSTVEQETQLEMDETQCTFYSADDMQMSVEQKLPTATEELSVAEEKEKTEDIYPNIYVDDEPEISEPEDDEATYIVSNKSKPNDTIFLTISSNFIREKDTITQRTKAKWSLKILESCERLRQNTLRINFDTVKSDRQERVYIVEEDLCLELERKLRDILATRDWSEMNQTMYRCVKCSCTFSQETKNYKLQKGNDVCCPQCESSFFVAQIHDIPLKPPLVADEAKLSPASIVEVSPVNMPLVVEPTTKVVVTSASDTNSIVGSGVSMRHNASNTLKYGSLLQHCTKSSANSLNESSSCSKISNSQSSFDSNQSMVGSSNTDREQDFRATVESDVDIISNPSQSSIEVLDHTASRKSSEERRLFTPNLPTIDDQSYTQHCIERYYTNNGEGLQTADLEDDFDESSAKTFETYVDKVGPNKCTKNNTLHNLTESSSSGSVTDSVCTTYEQQQQHMPETDSILKSPDADITSTVFGAFLQSTNSLMSSSKKKPSDKESKQNLTTCQPFKFNSKDLTDVDHRLKFYLYQTKFMEHNENFKWIVRGHIYHTKTNVCFDGIIVFSSCKMYVLEVYALEQEDVSKWLRETVSVKLERVVQIQTLPWSMGFSFQLQDWGKLLLLIQDENRMESILPFINSQILPNGKLIMEPQKNILDSINALAPQEEIRLCTILSDCVVTSDIAKRALHVCGLIITDTHLFLTSSKMSWLASSSIDENIEVCVIQFMSNLVDVDTNTTKTLTFNFLDETQNKCELWCCQFETQESKHKCLEIVSKSWEKLFGVSLVNQIQTP